MTQSLYESQALRVEALKAELAKEEAMLGKLRFPIQTHMYIHSNEDTNYENGKKLGLTETQLETFFRMGYEVDLTIQIDNEGDAVCTHLNGAALVYPVAL